MHPRETSSRRDRGSRPNLHRAGRAPASPRDIRRSSDAHHRRDSRSGWSTSRPSSWPPCSNRAVPTGSRCSTAWPPRRSRRYAGASPDRAPCCRDEACARRLVGRMPTSPRAAAIPLTKLRRLRLITPPFIRCFHHHRPDRKGLRPRRSRRPFDSTGIVAGRRPNVIGLSDDRGWEVGPGPACAGSGRFARPNGHAGVRTGSERRDHVDLDE